MDPLGSELTTPIPPQIDPSSASAVLATLQSSVKSSFDSINDSLKETHSGLNKYTKSLDKVLGILVIHVLPLI